MIRVKFLKSASTLSASYGKGAVAWLEEAQAHGFIRNGLCELCLVESTSEEVKRQEPKIIVQNIEPKEQVVIKPKRNRKK